MVLPSIAELSKFNQKNDYIWGTVITVDVVDWCLTFAKLNNYLVMLGTFIRERNQKLFPIISRIYFLFHFNDIWYIENSKKKCVWN